MNVIEFPKDNKSDIDRKLLETARAHAEASPRVGFLLVSFDEEGNPLINGVVPHQSFIAFAAAVLMQYSTK